MKPFTVFITLVTLVTLFIFCNATSTSMIRCSMDEECCILKDKSSQWYQGGILCSGTLIPLESFKLPIAVPGRRSTQPGVFPLIADFFVGTVDVVSKLPLTVLLDNLQLWFTPDVSTVIPTLLADLSQFPVPPTSIITVDPFIVLRHQDGSIAKYDNNTLTAINFDPQDPSITAPVTPLAAVGCPTFMCSNGLGKQYIIAVIRGANGRHALVHSIFANNVQLTTKFIEPATPQNQRLLPFLTIHRYRSVDSCLPVQMSGPYVAYMQQIDNQTATAHYVTNFEHKNPPIVSLHTNLTCVSGFTGCGAITCNGSVFTFKNSPLPNTNLFQMPGKIIQLGTDGSMFAENTDFFALNGWESKIDVPTTQETLSSLIPLDLFRGGVFDLTFDSLLKRNLNTLREYVWVSVQSLGQNQITTKCFGTVIFPSTEMGNNLGECVLKLASGREIHARSIAKRFPGILILKDNTVIFTHDPNPPTLSWDPSDTISAAPGWLINSGASSLPYSIRIDSRGKVWTQVTSDVQPQPENFNDPAISVSMPTNDGSTDNSLSWYLLAASGSLYVFGIGQAGQFCNGILQDDPKELDFPSKSPAQLGQNAQGQMLTVKRVFPMVQGACALLGNTGRGELQSIKCWAVATNLIGPNIDNTATGDDLPFAPITATGKLIDFEPVDTGQGVCFLADDMLVRCWGRLPQTFTPAGQFPDQATVQQNLPPAYSLRCKSSMCFIIVEGGGVYAWGSQTSGLLGTGFLQQSLKVTPPTTNVLSCPLGTQGFRCTPCPVNQYGRIESESAICVNCPHGKSSKSIAARSESSCLPCPTGQTSIAGEKCTSCLSGSFGNSTGLCTSCAPGQHNPRSGVSSCTDCDAGKYSPNTGAVECLECQPGSYMPDRGTPGPCLPCQPGNFSSAKAAHICSQCDLGTFSENPNAKQCTPCPPGTFNDALGQSTCRNCSVGTFSNIQGLANCFPCHGKTIVSTPGATICTLCPANTFPNQDKTACVCDENHYRFKQGQQCFPCPKGGKCINGLLLPQPGFWRIFDSPTFEKCTHANRCAASANQTCVVGSTGPLCAECSKGYGAVNGNCRPCGDPVWSVVLLAMFSLLLFLYSQYCIYTARKAQSMQGQVNKLSIGHLQMVALTISIPSNFKSQLSQLLTPSNSVVFNFDGYSVDCLTDSSFIEHFWIGMFLPIGLIVSNLLFNFAKKRLGFTKSSQISLTVVVMLFFSYVGVARLALDATVCRTLGGVRLLAADMTIRCDQGSQQIIGFVGLLVLLIFVVGLPLFTFLVMYRANKSKSFGSLSIDMQHEQDEQDTRTIAYGFLVWPYRPETYWWELIQQGRRVLFVAVLKANQDSPILQTSFGLLVMLLAAGTHEWMHPFKHSELQTLQSISISTTIANLVISLLNQQYIGTPTEDGASWVLSVLLIVINFSAIIPFVSAWWDKRDKFSLMNRIRDCFGCFKMRSVIQEWEEDPSTQYTQLTDVSGRMIDGLRQ